MKTTIFLETNNETSAISVRVCDSALPLESCTRTLRACFWIEESKEGLASLSLRAGKPGAVGTASAGNPAPHPDVTGAFRETGSLAGAEATAAPRDPRSILHTGPVFHSWRVGCLEDVAPLSHAALPNVGTSH